MKINIGDNINKTYTGIFLYDKNVIYTPGDIVIYKDDFFIVSRETPKNTPPDIDSPYYYIINGITPTVINNYNELIRNITLGGVSPSFINEVLSYYLGGIYDIPESVYKDRNGAININNINRNCILKIDSELTNIPTPYEGLYSPEDIKIEEGIFRSTGFVPIINATGGVNNQSSTVYQEVYVTKTSVNGKTLSPYFAIRTNIYNYRSSSFQTSGLGTWNYNVLDINNFNKSRILIKDYISKISLAKTAINAIRTLQK